MPVGCVWLVATLLGSTMIAVAWPSLNGRPGSPFFRLNTTVWASGVAMRPMLANVALSLFVLSFAAARSKLNRTLSARCAQRAAPSVIVQ